MIRLYKETAESVKLAISLLKYVLSREGYSPSDMDSRSLKDLTEHITGRRVSTNLDSYRFADLKESVPLTLNSMEGYLGERLSVERQSPDDRTDADLIDTVVYMLQLPWLQNRLGRDVISALRKAILTPSELTKFKEEVKKGELQCTGCGNVLLPETLMTLHRTGGSICIMCSACVQPANMMCQCGKCKPINDANARRLRAATKCTCEKKVEEGVRPNTIMLEPEEVPQERVGQEAPFIARAGRPFGAGADAPRVQHRWATAQPMTPQNMVEPALPGQAVLGWEADPLQPRENPFLNREQRRVQERIRAIEHERLRDLYMGPPVLPDNPVPAPEVQDAPEPFPGGER